MEPETVLRVLVRWAHVLAAVVAVGGTIYARYVLLPAARGSLADEQHHTLRTKLTQRWRPVVMICIAALLISGFYNFFVIGIPKAGTTALYHPLFGLKFLAALGVFVLASLLTGRARAFDRLRADAGKWLAVTAILGTVVILISGVLKNLGGP